MRTLSGFVVGGLIRDCTSSNMTFGNSSNSSPSCKVGTKSSAESRTDISQRRDYWKAICNKTKKEQNPPSTKLPYRDRCPRTPGANGPPTPAGTGPSAGPCCSRASWSPAGASVPAVWSPAAAASAGHAPAGAAAAAVAAAPPTRTGSGSTRSRTDPPSRRTTAAAGGSLRKATRVTQHTRLHDLLYVRIRGSNQEVVRVWWFMKYTSPSAVCACSHPSGNGPKSTSVLGLVAGSDIATFLFTRQGNFLIDF